MARIRTVKPELFISERVASCSVTAVVTYIGLFTQADDQGRHRDNAAIIAGVLWPLRAEHTPVHVEEDLQQLTEAGLICRYTGCDNKRYLHITGWFEHQKIDKPSQSRLPVCISHHPEHRCGPCKGFCSRTVGAEAETLPEASVRHPGNLAEESVQIENSQTTAEPKSPPHQQALPLSPQVEGAMPGVQAAQRPSGEASTTPRRSISEHSAPGSRISDPGSPFPTGRTATGLSTGASELVAEYVRACAQRPPGSVLGHLGREVKKMLNEGIDPEHIRAGLMRYADLQGHPSRLPSLVNDAMNARPRGGASSAHRAWTNPTDAVSAYAGEL